LRYFGQYGRPIARGGLAIGPRGQGRLQNTTSGPVKPEVVLFLTSGAYIKQYFVKNMSLEALAGHRLATVQRSQNRPQNTRRFTRFWGGWTPYRGS